MPYVHDQRKAAVVFGVDVAWQGGSALVGHQYHSWKSAIQGPVMPVNSFPTPSTNIKAQWGLNLSRHA